MAPAVDDDDGEPTEEPAPAWSKTYGHGDTWTEYHAYGLDTTTDGGYVYAAQSVRHGAGGYDIWVVRLDSDGDLVWEKGFGGDKEEEPFAVRQTSDGGFIVAGESWSFRTGTANCDAWVIKLTAAGSVDWQRSYGGTGVDVFHDIRETFDAGGSSTGFQLCGYTTSFGAGGYDVWMVRVNTSGTVTYEAAIGGAGNDFGRSAVTTPDGGCVLLADTQSFGAGGRDVWLVKLDNASDVEWERAYGGSETDFPRALAITGDGGYLVGAYTDSFGADKNDFWALKVDAGGDIDWQYTYGGSGEDIAHDIHTAEDGGYIMAGWTTSFGSDSNDAWIVKLDDAGLIEWQKRYNITYTDGVASWGGDDRAYRVLPRDHGFIVDRGYRRPRCHPKRRRVGFQGEHHRYAGLRHGGRHRR